MPNLNIFGSIERATRRIEPFHSQFLTDALNESLSNDRTLFDRVWKLATPKGWKAPKKPCVKSEYSFCESGGGQRIDICIVDGVANRVVGIEVKTSAGSVKEGQLEGYLKRFTEKYSPDRIAMAYLTPFNRERVNRLRADADARALSSVREFEEFAGRFPDARHLSWLDIADIEWQGGDSWRQHQECVRNYVAPESRLDTMISRDRSLDEFFGESAAEEFWDELGRAGVDVQAKEEGVRIDLEKFKGDPQALTRALEILILRGEDVSGTKKVDKFPSELRRPFLDSDHRAFHSALFDLSKRFDKVWPQGEKDYGLRVAHKNHASGVSLIRSKGARCLETGKPR